MSTTGEPDISMSEKFANFMKGIRELRNAGYKISEEEARQLFMGAEARSVEARPKKDNA